ncbi:MAG: rhomboid family intramembrane serine protease [Planctomycetes bacterium]|nr:rhomboid family intramembrane serine protease [Planctomycetota bacterium]
MLLVGDETQSHGRIPWVTGALVVINVLVFCAQSFLGEKFTLGFSLVPYEITHLKDLTKPERVKVKAPVRAYYAQGKRKIDYAEVHVDIPHAPGPYPIVLTLLTSMFLHGDWIHLIGNMWFLALFGRNVECALNHGRYLLFYLACGVIGGLVYTAMDPNSMLPALGASGAISGILGAYVAIYPLNWIKVWLGWWIGVIHVPAIVVLGVWFLFQYIAAFAALEMRGYNMGGTAYWDHLGGFAAGIGIIWGTIFYLKWKNANQPQEEETPEEIAAAEQAHDAPPAADPFNNFLPTNAPTHENSHRL